MSRKVGPDVPQPPPFRLTGHRPQPLLADNTSPFLNSLASAPENYLTDIPDTPYKPPVYEPIYYFFYGTLTQPEILSSVLDLTEPPEFRPARIVGYSLANWGQYRALVDGPQGAIVEGSAYKVRSAEDEYNLAHYETSAYRVAPCCITIIDGGHPAEVSGNTFKYAGDAQALREGRFDRKLWELQMGQRLPRTWDKK
jgi:Gamma-glutamyl cyclotransferase, AIG2-like